MLGEEIDFQHLQSRFADDSDEESSEQSAGLAPEAPGNLSTTWDQRIALINENWDASDDSADDAEDWLEEEGSKGRLAAVVSFGGLVWD